LQTEPLKTFGFSKNFLKTTLTPIFARWVVVPETGIFVTEKESPRPYNMTVAGYFKGRNFSGH